MSNDEGLNKVGRNGRKQGKLHERLSGRKQDTQVPASLGGLDESGA